MHGMNFRKKLFCFLIVFSQSLTGFSSDLKARTENLNSRKIASNTNPFADDESQCKDYSDKVSDDQRSVIGKVMASHEHRLHHALWHATRNAWSDLNSAERKVIQSLSPEWGKNAPICPPPTAELPSDVSANSTSSNADVSEKNTKYNPAGEEFLLMHHQMIDYLSKALSDAGQSCIAGWKTIPNSDDANWPVPAGVANDQSKSDYTGDLLQAWSKKFSDPKFLKGRSLSQVGYLMELSIHNNMHMRWADKPSKGDDFSPLDHAFTSASIVTESWHDDPKYDWLGTPYSAHVNPVFWKLHGWVDGVIVKWLKANNYSQISSSCEGKEKCYQWRSNWVGAPVHHLSKGMPGMEHGNDRDMGQASETVKKILPKGLFNNEKFSNFLNEPATKGTKSPGDSKAANLNDPEVFVGKFGPCSP